MPGLVQRAFAVPEVRRVIAGTLPELAAFMGVLRKCGFDAVAPVRGRRSGCSPPAAGTMGRRGALGLLWR